MATSTSAAPKRPRKRRRRAGGHPLYEDDHDAAPAVIIRSRIRQTQTGPVEERYKIPLWPEPPAPIATSAAPKRPRKRRRTKGGLSFYEDDDDMADAVIVRTRIRHTETGPVEERWTEPLWPEPPAPIEGQDQAAP